MSLAPMTVGLPHAAVIAAMQNACFPEDPWSAASIMGLMASPGTSAMVIPDGGFVLYRLAGDEAEVLALGVVPARRRRGLGRRLVIGVREDAGRRGAVAVFLEVAEDNAAARALYGDCGFAPVGRRPDYYRRDSGRMAALILRAEPLFGSSTLLTGASS